MGVTVDRKVDIADSLAGARARTTALLEPLDDAALTRQASPLMSPLVWDLAHVAHYEELWLLREIAGAPPTDELYDDVYDAFRHPRAERPTLPILGPAEAWRFSTDVRARVLDVLATIDLDRARPLLRDGFVYGMVAQHEHQHDETMLATLQLMEDCAHPDAAGWHPPAVGAAGDGVFEIPGGRYALGSDNDWVLDNERPVHDAHVAPFRIQRAPVTNHEFAAFVAAGGYDDERLWSRPSGRTRRPRTSTRVARARRAGGPRPGRTAAATTTHPSLATRTAALPGRPRGATPTRPGSRAARRRSRRRRRTRRSRGW